MPPQRRVDLDLDALAPPNRTIRLRGKVYELPGDIGIDVIVRAMQLQGAVNDEDESFAAVESLLDIIYDLFRECDPNFEPIPLTLSQVLDILGLVLSGANIDFEKAVQEALVGAGDEGAKDEEGDHPPTPPLRVVKPSAAAKGSGSRSRKRSPARS